MAKIVAHRGASADAPENTLAAFRLAWEQGADGIEGDFMLTADGEIVCFHDPDTQRLAGERWVVKETPLERLRMLDIGKWKGERWEGERIATLSEVLQTVPEGKHVVIELKDGPEIVVPFGKVLAAADVALSSILIISLVDETIAECRRQLPDLKCHWLSGYKRDQSHKGAGDWRPTAEEVIESAKRLGAAGFGSMSLPEHFDEAFVAKLRAAGIDEFHVWTVDDPEIALFYEGLGAWGITTNRPGYIRQALGKR
jgi:glycerophosphoryl diester phosphodiesterase